MNLPAIRPCGGRRVRNGPARSAAFGGECDKAGDAVALDANQKVVAPDLFRGSGFLLNFFRCANQAGSHGDQKIPCTQSLCRRGTACRNIRDHNPSYRLRQRELLA